MLNLRAIFTPKTYRIDCATADLVAARKTYDAAWAGYQDALKRGDTRDQFHRWPVLRAAQMARLAAERALRRAEEGRA